MFSFQSEYKTVKRVRHNFAAENTVLLSAKIATPGANQEKHRGKRRTVIFSLERLLGGGTRLTLEHANKVGKPALQIYDTRKERISNPDSLRLEVETLSDFLPSNKIDVLNVDSPSRIEGARCFRVDAKYFAPFS
jgi:hypothetical protein